MDQWPSGQGTALPMQRSRFQNKTLDGSKVDSAFHPSEVNKMSKLLPCSGSVALRLLNPDHKNGH